ncbi:primase-helicase family protein [Lutibacter sp.]|uniref:primase-helicase family protein n=1 Tax=Lutibacter sp. TaxID=1925666 RepID=UPI003562B593
MSYVKDTDILNATNGGLDIIKAYYPAAEESNEGARVKHFKLRESEKTASAALKRLDDGVWIVTDFGGDNAKRNGIQVCMFEENITYGEACALLGARYKIEGAKLELYMPEIEKRPLKKDETPGSYYFTYKEFTPAELALIGPRVNEKHCNSFNLKSCKSFAYCKANETVVTTATENYPIFVFDFGSWQKIYQPNSFEKKFRFRYAGSKPSKHIFGLDLIEAEFKRIKKQQEEEEMEYDDDDDEDEAASKKKDPRLDSVFIISGGSDGINLFSFNKFPLWFNSESEHLDWDDYKKLKVWVKEIYYIADLDLTGVKQAITVGLKFLDIKLLWLPEKLKKYSDKRGNPCKDFKDYVDKFYKKDNPNPFINALDKLENNALPMQFWTEYWNKKTKKTVFNLSNTRLYHFLANLGFGRYESENLKEGFLYIRKEGSIVRVLHPYEIENFVHAFLEERQMHPDLRDYIYKSPQLNERSLSKLPNIEIDFTDADKHTQYLFFPKKVWQVTKEGIKEFKQGEVDKFIWEDKIIDFHPQKEDPHFKISTDKDGDLDIEILKKDNPFFNYLINTSRVHWRKELEESFEGRPEKEADEYFKKNQFNIAGSRLSEDEILEQKQHLINKIYSIGYMLHKYKDESKAWCVFAMDNKLSDVGESHGGSGKSLCYSYLDNILKRRFYLKGRDEKLTQNDFIYHGVTEDTDYILIDDASQYLKFDFFFSEITGSLKVNPKNAQPFEIPFTKAPKFVISSNYTIRDIDPSTARRLLITVFSDYYHYNKDDEYKEERQVSDDFGGKNLFKDFTQTEWNAYYNFCAQCIQFFLTHPKKINPPMDNVTKRSLQAEMGDAFIGWAEAFFATEVDNIEQKGNFKYLDNFFSKEMAFKDFVDTTKQNKWTSNKFKKAMKAFCKWNGYVLNPKEFHNNSGRIIQKIGDKAAEVFFIKTIETPTVFKNNEGSNVNEILED